MKRAFAMVVALAGASALAAVEFSPLNVSSVELATGVTHPEFRDATNALWQAKLDKRIVHYRMPEGGASREFAETAEELREVMRRVGDPAFCQVDGAYMLTMTSAAVSPSGQEFMGNFRGPMDLTKDYVLAVSVTNSPAGVAYVSSVTFGMVERVVASTSEYNTTAKIMTRVEQKANASALNSYLLLDGSSHMTGSLKTSYGYDNVVQDNTSYPLTFMKKDTTAFTSNPFKFRQFARVTGDERFSYLTPDGTPVATSNMVEGIVGSVKDYADETFLPKIGSDDANITLKSLTMTSDESKIEFGGFDSEILIGDSPLKMGSNNATSMQAYGLFDEETGTVRPFVCFDNAWKVRFLSDDGATFSDFYPDGSVVLTSNMVESIVPSFISHTLPHFSNEVLAVGLNVDTNVVAALNAISGLPIDPTTGATTIAGIIAALAAAVAWLKKNKLTKGLTNGVPDDPNVSQLFTRDDTSTEIEIDGLLKNAELEKSVKVCAQKYGGTQIKQDDQGNFYYEVEE